jgi:metal-sulfur cluster biosynthetic enzyme
MLSIDSDDREVGGRDLSRPYMNNAEDAINRVPTEADIMTAIADVLDPELDEPLVKLGFIDRIQVEGSDVTVVFKLPTYWCSPNFAYLMASDLREKACAVPGVRAVRVKLLDHCVEDEVTNGINGGLSFSEAFPEESLEDEHLEALRRTFLRKGFLMRQDALIRQMLKMGLDEAMIATLQVADMTIDESANAVFVMAQGRTLRLEGMGRNAARYLNRRASLGLPLAPRDPLMINDEGLPVQPTGLQEFMRRSRSIRMSIMFNTSMCKGLFRTRYENAGTSEAYPEGESI